MAGAHDILRRRHGPGDDMHLDLQAHPGHAQGVGNAALVVHNVFLRQDVDHLAVRRNGHGPRRVQSALDVALGNFAALDGNDAVAVDAHDMAAGNAHVDRVDLAAGHELRVFHCLADGLHGLLDVDHHALAQTGGNACADAHHIHQTRLRKFAHHGADLCGADVKAYDELGLIHYVLLTTARHAPAQFCAD